MKRVRMASLVAARRSDSRATVSETVQLEQDVAGLDHGDPIFRRAFTFAHSGFRGTGRDRFVGKMRIQSLPLRFMLRVSATRAASIWMLVIQARSSVWRA